MEYESINLPCYVNGEMVDGLFDISESDEFDEVIIIMRSPVEFESIGENFFEALRLLRESLEGRGISVYCYGSAINFYPSPFILNTGSGRKAYRLTLGRQALSADLVDIFCYEDGLEISTVDEQRKWYEKWLRSLRQ